MAQFVHTIHEYIVLIARYLLIFIVIGFMPIPLLTFFGGDTLNEIDHNPLFQYFNHYQISTDDILENSYTNVYIDEKQKEVQKWEIDNAALWADYLAYQLAEQDIPVIRKILSTGKPGKIESLQDLHQQSTQSPLLITPELGQIFLTVKEKFEVILPIKSTQEARQWIIVALNSDEKNVKKEVKNLAKRYPNDNFLIVSKAPISLGKNTFSLQLPQFNLKQAKRIISEGLKISEAQAEILLIQHKRSLWSLNEANQQNQQFTLKSLLGQNYVSIADASKKESQALKEICQKNKAKVNKKLDLSDYGVVINNKNYQWANDQAELNYELEAGVLCGNDKWIDTEQSQQQQEKQKKQDKSIQESLKQLDAAEEQQSKQKVDAQDKQEKSQSNQSEEQNVEKSKQL